MMQKPTETSSFSYTTPEGLTLRGEVWPGGEAGSEEGDAPPMVFLPGNGFPVQIYRTLVSGLRGCGPVYGLNPRGIGGSDVPEVFDSWDVLLADLRGYVESNFKVPVVLGGHSLGAILSMRLAFEAPHLVRGLVMMEPVVRGGAEGAWDPPRLIAGRNIIERTRTRQAHWPTRGEAEAAFTGHPAYAAWDKMVLRTYLTHALTEDQTKRDQTEGDQTTGDPRPNHSTIGNSPVASAADRSENGDVMGRPSGGIDSEEGIRLACPPWLEATIYETEPQHRLFEYARGVKCPAVLMRGRASQDVSAAGLEELTRTLPVGVLYTLPGSHVFPMEHPKEAGAAMGRALDILTGETDLYRTSGVFEVETATKG